MKAKRNSKKVNVNEVSLRQIFEMFEAGEDNNLEGFDEFDNEEGTADEGADEDFGDEEDMGDEDFAGEEEAAGDTVSVEIDPNAPLADVLRTIADALDGGAAEDEDFGGEEETEGEGDDFSEEEGDDEDETFEDEGDGDEDWMPEEDEETPATVTDGAPRKKVGTPEYQGKNKQTVKTNLRTLTGQGNAATVTNGGPRKTVNTPEYQGKNKQTVDSKLNPTNQITQF